MSSEEEHKKQSHKGHKVNLKLKKKRKADKELKKKKTLSNKAYALIKDDERCKFFSQKDKIKSHQSIDVHGIRVDVLNKILKKFLKIFKDELQDFFDIFQQLDGGFEIDTSGIDDDIIRNRLEQIFRVLKIKCLKQGDETKYKHTDKGFKLLDYIKFKIDNIVDLEEDSQDQYSDADDEGDKVQIHKIKEISKELPEKKNVKKIQGIKMISQKKIVTQRPEFERKEVEIILKKCLIIRQKSNIKDKAQENLPQAPTNENDSFLDNLFGITETFPQQINLPKKKDLIDSKKMDEQVTQDQTQLPPQIPIRDIKKLPQKKLFNRETNLSNIKVDANDVIHQLKQQAGLLN